jgi:hypothetical protein
MSVLKFHNLQVVNAKNVYIPNAYQLNINIF